MKNAFIEVVGYIILGLLSIITVPFLLIAYMFRVMWDAVVEGVDCCKDWRDRE